MSQKDNLRKLITNHKKRLQKLEEQKAIEGLSVEPKVSIEIEDIKAEINRIRKELEELAGQGSEILQLLQGFGVPQLVPGFQTLYEHSKTYRLENPEQATDYYQRALYRLNQKHPGDLSTTEAVSYTIGHFYLLAGSIDLDEEQKKNLERAKIHYDKSQIAFHRWQWKHLESLAYLGLAMTLRRLENYAMAHDACNKALECLKYESIFADNISQQSINALNKAIEAEISIIQLDLPINLADVEKLTALSKKQILPQESIKDMNRQSRSTIDDTIEVSSFPNVTGKTLPIFKVSEGKGLITTGEVNQLNRLCREDYEKNVENEPEKVILKNQSYLKEASYLLEIDKEVKAHDGLKPGDWLLIREGCDLTGLTEESRSVVVLVEEEEKASVYLRTCIKADDHYFLKAQKGKNGASIIVVNYQTSVDRIRNIDALHYEQKLFKRVDDIQVNGPIIRNERIPKEKIVDRVQAFVWRVPVVSQIAAGLDAPVIGENIEHHIELKERNRQDSDYFIVEVKGNSMLNVGILPSDNVLIHQQEAGVINGDIVAAVIKTSDRKALGVLKRYFFYEHEGYQHWHLQSENDLVKDLVVIPNQTNPAKIRNSYRKKYGDNKIEFFEQAELKIAGKYIRRIRKYETVY